MKIKKIPSQPLVLTGPWFTLPEAAAYTRLGLKAIRNYIYDGLIPAYKPRKVCLIKKIELDEFIENKKMKIPEATGARAK